MKRLFGRSGAEAMIAAALAMRLFIGMAVDFPVALNASWLCPLLGFAIYLPFLFALLQAQKLGNGPAWDNLCAALPRFLIHLPEGIFALLLAWDAAATLRLTASSSNIIALGDVTVHLLIVPLCIVSVVAILSGGDALGDSARIALRILPLFALIVVLVQLREYRFGWLTPLLGQGYENILRGGIYCAGCMALLSLPWLIALPDRGKSSLLRCTLLPALGVSVLMLMQHMSAPAMPQTVFTRAARIELVLSNGRMSLYPQFVLNLLWYGGLLYLLSAEVVSAAGFIRRILPKLKPWIIALAVSVAIGAGAMLNPNWLKQTSVLISVMFVILGAALALPMLLYLAGGRRRKI